MKEEEKILVQRSLLAQTVETQLLPEERFKERLVGEVQDIKKIDEVVGILSKIENHYEALMFDGLGNLSRVHLDPTTYDIADANSRTYIAVDKTNDYSDDFSYLLRKIGFSKKAAQETIQTTWRKIAKNQLGTRYGAEYGFMMDKTDVRKNAEFFIPVGKWEMKIRKVPEKNTTGFIFQTEENYFFINPTQPATKKTVTNEVFSQLIDPSAKLIGELTLKEEAHFFKINGSDGKELASFSGSKPTLDPNDQSKLYFINTGGIYSLDLNGVADRSARPLLEAQIRVENPEEIEIDPNVNFFIVRSGQKLSIIDKESGEVVKEFNNVLGPILVDKQGDILYVDTENKLREIQTNFQAIPTGGSELAHEKREEQLREMQERFASLELKRVQKQKGNGISEEDVANTLREAIARQVDEPLVQTTDPEAIEEIMDRLQGLKADPANQAYGEVVDEFISKAREKLSGIRTAEFDNQLAEYEKSITEVKSMGDTIGLDEEFARLLELRQKTDVTDPATRRNIEQRLRSIQAKKEMVVGQYQQELSDAIQGAFPNIEQLIKETGSSQELAMFGTTIEAQQFEMMLANVRDPQVRKELRDKLNIIKSEQRSQLESRGRQLEEEQRLRWAQLVEEAKEDLASLREQITELSDTRELDRFDRNPLVTAWRAKIFALPPELREIEEKKLEVVMGARKKDIEHRKELGVVGDTGELKFGQVSFPVYKEPPRLWRPVLLPIAGAMHADLAFQDEQGRLWHPSPDHRTPVIPDLNFEDTARMIERHRKEAEDHFKGLKREVPEYNDRWKISEYQNKKLEELAESLNIQMDNHMGITILEGEAGTGKNVLIDVLANLSNREVVTIACNENTAKEDLTYEFYYDPDKGTYKLPSRLIEALQKPGAIILFDEINTVKPGIVKMLNPLFDYRRKLVVNEGGVQHEVIADPTVILAGTMNPQDYAGVDKLAETILSRGDIIEVAYPPFEEPRNGRTYYRSDEAEMLFSYVHVLESLQQKEFKQAWDYIINRDTTNGGDMLLKANANLEKDVRRLYDAIRVANDLRRMYQAYQVGESNEPMDFTTSLREMVNIALRMNHAANVKDVCKRVILPKIGDRRQRILVDHTIDSILR
ncbi:MAG: AAA family ATPase [Microgenomates group bacterium]|jgi:MoxR-like ATPase